MENVNVELIRGHMDTIILRTLQDNDKYGLEMLGEIRSLSEDLYSLKQPTLYSSLKRLEKQGLIESYPGSETKGANRTYYKLTESGRDYLIADQKQWEFSRTIIDKLLSDREFDKETDTPPFDPSDFRPSTKRERREKPEQTAPTQYVYKYVEKEVEKEVVKTVVEEKIVEVVKEVPVEVIKEIPVEVIREIPVEVERIVEVPILQETNTAIESETMQTESEIAGSTTDSTDTIILEPDTHAEADTHTDTENLNESEIAHTDEYIEYTPLSDITSRYDEYPEYSRHYSYQETPRTYDVLIDTSIDYTSQLDGIFSANDSDRSYVISDMQEVSQDIYQGDDMDMTQIKEALATKNINLRPYQFKETGSYYRGNYYYSKKVLRDWSIVTYIIYAIYILISYFSTRSLGSSLEWSLGFLFGGLIFPIACFVVWKISPQYKKRNTFNVTNALLTAFVMMIAFAVVIMIVGFFFVKIDASNPVEYIPTLVLPICSLLLLPLSVGIYAIFYNQKAYRV